jgi:hypothetical protein
MSQADPNALLWDLMRGAMATKAFGTVVDLGVADTLADGARPVSEIAAETGADAGTLHRIMRSLASDGVFAEEEPGIFRNTEASELFRRDRENSWPEFAHLFGGVFYDAIAGLDPRTSGPTFEQRFGSEFWPWLEANPAERAAFDAAMAGGKEQTADLLAGLDWRGDETIIDVGGGNGALLRALLDRVPGVSGIVFDLPETQRDSNLGERLAFVEGSFFERVPAGDAYVLSRILHDWDDAKAAAILRVIREAAPDEARLLVVDAVVPPGNDPHASKWLDLLMLVLAGGRERNESDWRALLGDTGFELEQIEDGLIQARCR